MGAVSQYMFIEGNINGSDVDVDCFSTYGGTILHITDPDKKFMYYESNYQPVKYDVSTGYEEALPFTSYVPNYSSGFDEYIESIHKSAYITVTGTPNIGDTITINGVVFTFRSSLLSNTDVGISVNKYETARNIMYAVCAQSVLDGGLVLAEAYGDVCYLISTTSPGVSYSISKSSSALTISDSTMSQNRTKITLREPWLNRSSSMSYDIGYRHIDASLVRYDYNYSFYFHYDTNRLFYSRSYHGGTQNTGVKQFASISCKDTYVIPCIGYEGVCVAIVRIGYDGKHYVSMYNVDSQLGDPTTTDGIVEYVWNPPVSYEGRLIFDAGVPIAIYVDTTTDENGIAYGDSTVLHKTLRPIGQPEYNPFTLYVGLYSITELCVRDNRSYAIRDINGVKNTYDIGEPPMPCYNIDGDISNPYNIMYLYPYGNQSGGDA